MENGAILNLALSCLIALLAWGVFTIHQLSISTASLSKSVEYIVVENLPARVTTLEVMVQELAKELERDVQK